MAEEKTDKKNLQKYLIFSVGREFYGASIIKVREIIRFESITPVHDTLEYIKGVINLRGKIIPIMDLRLKFGMEEKNYTDKTVIVILDINGEREVFNLGIAVDAVHEVVNVEKDRIEATPRVGLKMKSQYLEGIVESGDGLVMILDMDKITTSDEIVELTKIKA